MNKTMELPYILRCFIDGKCIGTKIYEIIATLSVNLDKLTYNDCLKLNETDWIFSLCYNKNRGNYISVSRYGRTESDSKNHFVNLITNENLIRKQNNQPEIQFDLSKIQF